jgi:acyl-CoA thioester hydrolase
MYTHVTELRVRYGETDRMGYVYYGIYAQYFEVGRVEALRDLGFPYRDLEDVGILLPVHDLSVRYHKPAFYDDRLRVSTTIAALPTVRVVFTYEVRNERDELLTEATTTLVFVDKATGRPRRAPDDLITALAPYFP